MTIRIALVGANYGASLASGFAGLDGVELVGIADSDPATLARAAAALSIANTYATVEELLAAESLDALIVATPTHLHERHAQSAFDKGHHVLTAAPIGVRESEVSHISTSAGLVGKVFMYANPLRYDDRIRNAYTAIESGSLGDALFASGCIQISDWPYPSDSWRLERDLGGGALMEVGVPALDALWFAMGAPDPMQALATHYAPFSKEHASDCEHPAEDSLTGFVRFKNNAALSFTARLQAPIPAQETRLSLSISTTQAQLDLEAGAVSRQQKTPEPYAKASDDAACFRVLAEDFIQAIESGEAAHANGKQALALQKMADALRNAAREQNAVSIKVERSLDDLFGGL